MGCLTIGFPLLHGSLFSDNQVSDEFFPRSLREQPKINAWLEILEDGRVRVLTGKMELGQGIRTAIAQVAAEELDMDINKVAVHLAETEITPHEGYTAGSGSIEQSAMSVRYAAASARKKILELAAVKMQTDEKQLSLKNGSVTAFGGNRKMSFAEVLAGNQIEDEVKLPVALKEKSKYRYVGKSIPRSDIEKMVRGEEVYIQDLRLPGMVHARVARPNAYNAALVNIDEKQLRQKVSGILKVVRDGNFLAVVAEEEYQAVKAQVDLKQNAEWKMEASLPVTKNLKEYIQSLPTESENVKKEGNVDHRQKNDIVKASYFRPYQMHASIGPSCAIALYEKNQLFVWSHSQGVYPLRESMKHMLNMDEKDIHIKGVPGSGCYGHNGADDVAADVALIARAYPGKPVKLQWSRSDEHAWEPYGSAMVMDLEARLDGTGKISSWKYDLWSDSHSTRPGREAAQLLPARYLKQPFKMQSSGFKGGAYRNSQPYYQFPNVQVDYHYFKGPLRVSALRSLGAYANIFAIESFMDELAVKAGKDPVAFRMQHLGNARAREVLQKVQGMAKEQKLNANEGMGYGFSRYKNEAAWCAVAAKVVVDAAGKIQVKNMWAAIDAGEVINIDGVKNQTEGGMVQAASWTLFEEVKYDKQHITSKDWGSYPIYRFEEVPLVEVEVIQRLDEKPLGAGEAAQGPAAAAVANAVFWASGKRVRNLPILHGNPKG